jgi:hypothetical protein
MRQKLVGSTTNPFLRIEPHNKQAKTSLDVALSQKHKSYLLPVHDIG